MADIVRLQRIRDLVRRGVNIAGVREILEPVEEESQGDASVVNGAGLGERLRALRLERGLSIRRMGSKTGLSPSTISSFERSLHRPSVTSLQKIANALDTNLNSLMEGGSFDESSAVIRKQDRRRIRLDSPGVIIEQLASVETQLEPLLFSVAPGATSGSSSYAHEGEQFLYLLKGVLEFTLDELTTYNLNEGDSLTFASVRPHRLDSGVRPGEGGTRWGMER